MNSGTVPTVIGTSLCGLSLMLLPDPRSCLSPDFTYAGLSCLFRSVASSRRMFMAAPESRLRRFAALTDAFGAQMEAVIYDSVTICIFLVYIGSSRSATFTLECHQVLPYVHHKTSSAERRPVTRERSLHRSIHAVDWQETKKLPTILCFASWPSAALEDQELYLGDTLGEYAVRCTCKCMLF